MFHIVAIKSRRFRFPKQCRRDYLASPAGWRDFCFACLYFCQKNEYTIFVAYALASQFLTFKFMLQSRHCVVLGGGGFIGSHVADALLAHGYSVSVFGRRNSKKTNLLHLLDRVRLFEGDFNNEADLEHVIRGADYVFHLISSTLPATSNDNPIYDAEVNLIGTIRLLKLCVAHKAESYYDFRCYR